MTDPDEATGVTTTGGRGLQYLFSLYGASPPTLQAAATPSGDKTMGRGPSGERSGRRGQQFMTGP